MESQTESQIETFELGNAKLAWDALAQEQKDKILSCHNSPDGVWINRVEVKTDSKYPSFWMLVPDGTDGKGKPKYRKEAYDTTHPTTPEWKALLTLGLVTIGVETSMNWGLSGGPPVYKLTRFGEIVGRYGNAVTIVERVKRAIGQ